MTATAADSHSLSFFSAATYLQLMAQPNQEETGPGMSVDMR